MPLPKSYPETRPTIQPNPLGIQQIAHRLKTRLALARFKHQHGYEHYDLVTLESSLLSSLLHIRRRPVLVPHRYYPSHPKSKTFVRSTASFAHAPTPTCIRSPLSAKRNTSRLSLSSDDEDAANLLVMLHRMACLDK
ncbi:hypothetical protein CLU79DRAFT_838759 [Phycomyces nitens]|nr:hypothetical protein CLU79DRAFT_838759 [Phycomyces nitens]